jgi:hypothetical protein
MIKVYTAQGPGAVVIDDGSKGSGGMRFDFELRAIGNGDGTVSISSPTRGTDTSEFYEMYGLPYTEYVDESGAALGADEPATVNALNAILRNSGGADGNPPVITSSLSITVTDGTPVNYTLTATDGVGYEWSNLPDGLTVGNGNRRNLLGEITAGIGTYNVQVTAANAFGSTTETLVITVTAVPFSNTKSIEFENQDWMGANASLLSTTLGRSSNGSGSSDAWSIGLWYNASTATQTQTQTIVYFGDNDSANGGSLSLSQITNASGTELRFRYGSSNNRLQLTTNNGALTAGTWQHILITYTGGTTGSSSAEVGAYYGRFKIYVDGTLQSTTNSHANYGWSAAIDPDNFRLGRFTSGNYLRNDAKIDELAVWDSDQSGNISDLYNGGATQNLNSLGTPPDHWWRMGDGDTYPVIQDNVGTAHFVMYNMTAADIVNDVP